MDYIKLAEGYVKSCKRNWEISEIFSKYNIIFEDFYNPLNTTVEQILEDYNPHLIDMLLEFANNGYVEIFVDDKREIIASVKEIFEVLKND